MAKPSFMAGLLYLMFWGVCNAQEYSSIPQSSCINPEAITASDFGKCDSMHANIESCTRPTASAMRRACFCRQEVLNGIIEYYHDSPIFSIANICCSCQSEMRFCLGMNNQDIWLDFLDEWHTKCDSEITYTLTTPILSSYTPIDINACNSAWNGCMTESSERAKCQNSTIHDEELQSCFCRTQVLAAAFTCSYFGNVSCHLRPGATSAIRGHSYCPEFPSVVQSLLSVRTLRC